jgi:lipoprotein-anchoring transpeptidase ErfK/SrfK
VALFAWLASCAQPAAAPSRARPVADPPRRTGPERPTALPVASAPAPPSAEVDPDPAPPPAPAPAPARITSRGYVTWIWPKPKASGRFLGFVRFGQSIALRSTEMVRGEGCPGGFFEVEPRGYVCSDRTVTREPSDHFRAVAAATAPRDDVFPFHYALSDGAPMYNRAPTEDEQRKTERPLGPAGAFHKLYPTLAAHEDLATADPIAPVDAVPDFVSEAEPVGEGRLGLVFQTIPRGSMLSFTRAFSLGGRTFLLSSDMTVVPADRVRAFRPSAFHGVRLGDETKLPLAWMRRAEKPKWRKNAVGAFEATTTHWSVRSFVELTGERATEGRATFLETREPDPDAPEHFLYVAENDATVVERAAKIPLGVGKARKWIVVRISDGTLVAYDGLEPVYATLVSPGAGGVPRAGVDPVKASTTPLGVYPVTFKDRAATMSPDRDPEHRTFWIADVPHTQYFNPPFALHAAYWHERFGEPTSAGCINLSPIDAKELFDWSDPPVPEGWEGATGAGAPENGPTTAVVVRR